MVSAWANSNNLVLGQRKVDDKSNEITAIPKLLAALELSGAVVTIDAIGCQRSIAGHIVEQGADFLLKMPCEIYDQNAIGHNDARHHEHAHERHNVHRAMSQEENEKHSGQPRRNRHEDDEWVDE
jgi:predicted transposase YbfD/YdcC